MDKRPALEGDEWKPQEQPNGNLEFSWVRDRLEGQNILPSIRDQEKDLSCAFHAISSAAEMDILRHHASHEPGSTSDVRFDASSYAREYERLIGMTLEEESCTYEGKSATRSIYRDNTALELFESNGVIATSANWAGERRLRLKNFRTLRMLLFQQVARYIVRGRGVLGGIPVTKHLASLGRDEIFEVQRGGVKDEILGGHMVLFIGYGLEGGPYGRPYLVFMSSSGPDFADNGFGRIYFDQTYNDRLYIVEVEDAADMGSSAKTNDDDGVEAASPEASTSSDDGAQSEAAFVDLIEDMLKDTSPDQAPNE